MRQRNSHIAPLAFLMLILFVSPMTVKAVHHHLPMQMHASANTQGSSVSAAVGACPVCQFEFVTFIAFNIPEHTHFNLLASLDCFDPILGIKGNSFTSYSLRAPPAI